MRFAEPIWLLGSLFCLAVAALLIAGIVKVLRARKIFGEEHRINQLITFDAVQRRVAKSVFLTLAVGFAFVALARPQFGRGQRLVPATNLDIVITLDFSKSMYARDISPSRIARAKAEVAKLTKELVGARFGAVAFAGEPMGFPLTVDGGAIAQFLRQIEPNDMPVGGTAIAKALEKAREIFARDPKAKEHRKVIVLITDGEDLEGDPVQVASLLSQEGITINVVQIGGRTPERIPEVGPNGTITGWRKDEQGNFLTTQLTAEGEAQLAKIAEETQGILIRSGGGSTGIEQMTIQLKKMMKEELAERVETVFEDKFAWPLGLSLLLLLVEAFLNEAPTRHKIVLPSIEGSKRRKLFKKGVNRG